MGREPIGDLARRIHEIEASERPCVQAMPLTTPALQAVLPGGLPGGGLVEVVSAMAGSGAGILALLLAKEACAEPKILVVADGQHSFYPPAAAGLGIDLQRTLILRASTGPLRGSARQVTALVQALRCPAVGAVIGRFERLTAAEYRALQLAAETGGGVGFLVRPATALGAQSFAALRLLVTPHPSSCAARLIQVEVLRERGGRAGRCFVLEIDHETGHVRLPASVAVATPAACSA